MTVDIHWMIIDATTDPRADNDPWNRTESQAWEQTRQPITRVVHENPHSEHAM